jgi:hypothetical protein
MNRPLEIKMLPTVGATRRPVPYQILGRTRRHVVVGRVVTLTAATAFDGILSVALLPLATRQLGASDYGIYGLVISIVVLVSAAADGGAGLLVPACTDPRLHRSLRDYSLVQLYLLASRRASRGSS